MGILEHFRHYQNLFGKIELYRSEMEKRNQKVSIFEENIAACQAEAERLESWHEIASSEGVLDSESNARVVGVMLAAMNEAPGAAKMMCLT